MGWQCQAEGQGSYSSRKIVQHEKKWFCHVVTELALCSSGVQSHNHSRNDSVGRNIFLARCITCILIKDNVITMNRAWNQSACFTLTQWLKIIPHMIRSYYRCWCINKPVIFSHCAHLKLEHRFHALMKVWTLIVTVVHFFKYWLNSITFQCSCSCKTSKLITNTMPVVHSDMDTKPGKM